MLIVMGLLKNVSLKLWIDETKALTLKNEICNLLTWYNLLVKTLRGQRYDGSSNMVGE